MRKGTRYLAGSVGLAVAATLVTVGISHAAQSQSTVVNAVPSTATPNIVDGTTFAIAKVGNQIVVGGSFTQVENRGSTTVIDQPYVLAFDASSGLVNTNFHPLLDGEVDALLPGPAPNTVYVGGAFTNLNGVKTPKLTLLSTTTGLPVAKFHAARLDGAVHSMAASGGRLFVGGIFATAATLPHAGLVTLNPITGSLDPYMNLQLAGHHNYNGTSGAQAGIGPEQIAISPDGTKMAVIGNFTSISGVGRDQIALVTLGGRSASLANWQTDAGSAPCNPAAFDDWVRGVDFAPDGSYFVVDGTGGPNGGYCDSAFRFESNATGAHIVPTWADFSGGDTFLSVSITGSAIYVGGHFRWLNNPLGHDSSAAGAVGRAGLAALDPKSGLPLPWNPGRNPRGYGAPALLATTDGLYVGSDTDFIGDNLYKRGKIAYFPLAGGAARAAGATASVPGTVYLTNRPGPTGAGAYKFAGSTPTAAPVVTTAGANWSTAHGAFMVDNTVFYGMADGWLYRRTFTGSAFGSAAKVNPYSDPLWDNVPTGSGTSTYAGVTSNFYAEIPAVSSMFFANGKLFYTRAAQSAMNWRWFNPDSGIVGATESTVAGTSGFTNVGGVAFVSGSTFYFSRTNGDLYKMGWTGSAPTGTAVPISGPGVDKANWNTPAGFLSH